MRYLAFLLTLLAFFPLTAQISTISSTDLFPNELEGWSKSLETQVTFDKDEISISAIAGDATLMSVEKYEDFIINGQCYLDEETRGEISFRQRNAVQESSMSVEFKVSLNHFSDQQNPTGSIIDMARGTWLPSFDTAGWFDLEISALADHLQIKINGIVVAQTFNRRSLTGHVGFRVPKGSLLRFRNIQISTVAEVDLGVDIRDHFDSHPSTPFEIIFDGKTTAGWSAQGDGTWEVENGILHGFSGNKGGFLVTENAYKDFHLILDFKIKKEDNSGIFIRRSANENEVTLQNSVECNIYDHNGYAHAYSTGSLATYARAWSNLISYESWNTAEILAWGDQIAMYINGIKASHANLPKFNRPGNICLQGGIKIFSADKGPSDIYFRNIRIRSLD